MAATLSLMGDPLLLLPISLIMALLVASRASVFVSAWSFALAIALLLTFVVKIVAYRCQIDPSAPISNWRFLSPSGHTSLATAFYGCTAVFLASGKPGWQRLALAFLTVAIVVAVGASRVMLLDHSILEVMVGSLLGAIAVLAFVLVIRHPPSPPRLNRGLLAALGVLALGVFAAASFGDQWTVEAMIHRAAMFLGQGQTSC